MAPAELASTVALVAIYLAEMALYRQAPARLAALAVVPLGPPRTCTLSPRAIARLRVEAPVVDGGYRSPQAFTLDLARMAGGERPLKVALTGATAVIEAAKGRAVVCLPFGWSKASILGIARVSFTPTQDGVTFTSTFSPHPLAFLVLLFPASAFYWARGPLALPLPFLAILVAALVGGLLYTAFLARAALRPAVDQVTQEILVRLEAEAPLA